MKTLALIVLPAGLAVAGVAWAQSDQTQPGAPAAHSHPVVPIAGPAAAHNDNSTARSMTDALNTLEAQGMGSFSNFHQNSNGASATISQGGRQYDVTVDPNNAQVARQP